MKQVFNYNKFGIELADEIVDSMYTLSRSYIEGKANTPEYQALNSTVNEKFMKYCVESIPGQSYSGLEQIKNPMIHKNVFFQQTFDTVLAQAITPVLPTVVAAGYENLYDTVQVGWGDSAKYFVESNELFIVNNLATGVARGGVQTAINTEYTVQASPKQVALYVDWYHVVAGKQDWGYMCSKIGASFAAYVQAKVASAMASTITDGAKWGIGGYIASGLTDENWLITSRNVRLANGGADVYALGTQLALASVLPAESATSQFRYGENSEIIKKGFLPAYKNVPLVELGNALVPNTINGTPEVVVSDDIIYMIPMGLHKPVKVVFEGNSVTVEKDPLYQPDHCYGFAITTYMGVDVVVGTKFGAIELA